MDLQKLDKIVLTRDDAVKIMEWDRVNHHNYNKDEAMSFPLEEGVIELQEDYNEIIKMQPISLTYFKITKYHILFRQFDKYDMKELLSWKLDGSEDNYISDMKSYVKLATKEVQEQQAKSTIFLAFCIFQYMTTVTKDVVEKKENKTIKKKQKSKKSSASSKSKYTKISTIKYTFDFDNEHSKDYQRHTLAWTVRGHWRQLKNGQKVWIKPYTKGDPKDVEPKQYKL